MKLRKRILILLVTAILITVFLYQVDTDPPTDTRVHYVVNTSIVFCAVTVVYLLLTRFPRKKNAGKISPGR